MIDVSGWSGLQLLEPVQEGNRNEVWRARLGGADVAVRKSRRSEPSLVWELDLLDDLERAGFSVPTSIRCDDGRRFADGVVVQVWLDGRPPSSDADWRAVADDLQRLHANTGGYRQRPGRVTGRELADARRSVDADLDAVPAGVAGLVAEVFGRFGDVPTAVVHGDPGPSNIRIAADGRVGLLDWDEARVDLTWHDLSNLGIQILDDREHRRAQDLSNAWEAVNAWTAEPDYAMDRLRQLDPPGTRTGPRRRR